MRKIFLIILLVGGCLWMGGCSDSDDEKTDTILLSEKTVEFPAASDSIALTTKGANWKIKAMVVNGTFFYVQDRGEDTLIVDRIWCTVERRGKQKLFIKAEANNMDAVRQASVTLEDNGYYDYVEIRQAAKKKNPVVSE